MIPYPAALEFFMNFYNALPVSFRAYFFTTFFISLALWFLIWLVTQILG